MSPLRLNGSTSGYAELAASDTAGDVILTLPSTAGTLDRTNRAGNILQVVQTVKSDTFSTVTAGQNVYVSITGLSASITPASASNKILIQVELGGSGASTSSTLCSFKVQRSNSDISGMLGNARTNYFQSTAANIRAVADSNSAFRLNMTYLDSPSSTSSLTYQVLGQAEASGFFINRTINDSGSTNFSATQISSITLIEVSA